MKNNSTDQELKEILNKTNTVKPSFEFTDNIMAKVKVIVIRDIIFKKYFKRSSILTFVSITLLIGFLIILSQINSMSISFNNQSLALIFLNIPYFIAATATVLVFFQLNNILSLRYKESKQTD